MSSIPRNLQRKVLRNRLAAAKFMLRRNPEDEGAKSYISSASPTQITRPLPNGGYRTLRPTKGWATFSAKRLAAILTTQMLKGGTRILGKQGG